VYLRMNTLVGGIVNEDGVESNLVKDCEHCSRRVGKEVGKDWLGEGEMKIGNFKRLRVRCNENEQVCRSCQQAKTYSRRGCGCVDRKRRHHSRRRMS
jgi:hypothetical protein